MRIGLQASPLLFNEDYVPGESVYFDKDWTQARSMYCLTKMDSGHVHVLTEEECALGRFMN